MLKSYASTEIFEQGCQLGLIIFKKAVALVAYVVAMPLMYSIKSMKTSTSASKIYAEILSYRYGWDGDGG